MAMATEELRSDSQPLAPAVPNFREDERIAARYKSMLERRIKAFFVEHESSIRRNASAKRDALREESEEAQAEWERCKEAAESTREAYRQAYPDHVKKTRLAEPSVIENVRSLGAANKLYNAAQEAWRAAESASSNLRRLEHNDEQLDVELKKALERAPAVSKEVTESQKWLAEIHQDEELASVKAKVDEINAEREGYAARLAAGKVPAEELRLRAFAEQDVKHISLPFNALTFLRVDRFGNDAYFIMRDLRKQLYGLPYDHRLEPLLDGVFDVTRNGEEFAVRRATQPNGPLPLTLLEHFKKCSDNDEAAQEAYRQHQEFVRERRMLATVHATDEKEAQAIELLAKFAVEQPH